MTMELISPTLDDMGYVFWGPDWRRPLAEIMGVTEDDILIWETEPARRPADLQDTLENIGLSRIGEIEVMVAQMKAAGLRDPAE